MSNEEGGRRLWLCNHVKLLENIENNEEEKQKRKMCLCVICKGLIDAIEGNPSNQEVDKKWGHGF